MKSANLRSTAALAGLLLTFGAFAASSSCDGPEGKPQSSGGGGVTAVNSPCSEQWPCQRGHVCKLGTLEPDAAVAGGRASVGVCSKDCQDALCTGEREECSSAEGVCQEVTCGRIVKCPENPIAVYCSIADHSCHNANGQCIPGGSGADLCPTLGGILPEGIGVTCERPDPSVAGKCKFSTAPALCPVESGTLRDIEFEKGDTFGMAFESVDALEFRYRTTEAHFIYVTTTLPEHVADVDRVAIWAATLPAAPAAQANRTVHWADGGKVKDGVWTNEPASAEPGVTLYAMVYVVSERAITHASSSALIFRIGEQYPQPGTACETSIAAATITTGKGLSECWNPETFMGCFDGVCRVLCLGSGGGQCQIGEECQAQTSLGLYACVPNSSGL